MMAPLGQIVETGIGIVGGGALLGISTVLGVVLYHTLPFLLKRAEGLAQQRKDRATEEAAREAREREVKSSAWADAKAAYEKWLVEQDQQNTRLQGVVDRQQQAIDAIQARYADCLQTRAQQTGTIHFLHAGLRRAFAELKGLGRDPGELPDLPQERPHEAQPAEFLARQVAQDVTLTREMGAVIRDAKPGGPDSHVGGSD